MSHERFFKMLDRVPRIKHLWNKHNGKIDQKAFEAELSVMSSGEVQIAKFLASLWFHDNTRYGFDLVDAVASIDENEKKLIIDWMSNPFWP